MKALLQQYFALRRERERTVPPEVVKVERGFERVEGIARYVDRTGITALNGGGEAMLKRLIVEDLKRDVTAEGGAYATAWFRQRSYSTGAAITYLVSRHGGDSWRSEIESGSKPDALLEAAIGPVSPQTGRRLANAARKSFGYEKKYRELEPAIRAAEKKEIKSKAEFLALGSFQVILETGASGVPPKVGFRGVSMTPLAPAVMALPRADTFDASADSFSLSVRGRPMLMEALERRYTALLPAAPMLNGGGAPSPGEHRLEKLQITAEGYELKTNRPATLLIEQDRWVVRLDAK
jgi:hypothetical protein